VVGLATCGGAGGGSSWWLERQGEKKTAKTGQKGWFLADFGPDFLLPQAMKSTSIYRRLKRAILSSPGKNFQTLI